MKKNYYIIRILLLVLATGTLSGCVAGPVVQQLATSIIMRGADKITADAYEAKVREEKARGIVLKDTVPDEYYAAFISSGFESVQPVAAPQPGVSDPVQEQLARIESSRLVRVELWNLLLGDEKRLTLEKAYLLGSASVPPVNEWDHWQVATGASEATANLPITFLIPPELGRAKAGGNAVVEITQQGGLHVARYLNSPKSPLPSQAKDQSALIASQSGQSLPSYSR